MGTHFLGINMRKLLAVALIGATLGLREALAKSATVIVTVDPPASKKHNIERRSAQMAYPVYSPARKGKGEKARARSNLRGKGWK